MYPVSSDIYCKPNPVSSDFCIYIYCTPPTHSLTPNAHCKVELFPDRHCNNGYQHYGSLSLPAQVNTMLLSESKSESENLLFQVTRKFVLQCTVTN